MPGRVVKLLRIRVSAPLWLYIVMWLLIIGGLVRIEQTVHQNRTLAKIARQEAINRSNAIQESRFNSCKAIYQSFPDMFRTFFPKDRKEWTAIQNHNWKKLQDRAKELAREKCRKQVQIHNKESGNG